MLLGFFTNLARFFQGLQARLTAASYAERSVSRESESAVNLIREPGLHEGKSEVLSGFFSQATFRREAGNVRIAEASVKVLKALPIRRGEMYRSSYYQPDAAGVILGVEVKANFLNIVEKHIVN